MRINVRSWKWPFHGGTVLIVAPIPMPLELLEKTARLSRKPRPGLTEIKGTTRMVCLIMQSDQTGFLLGKFHEYVRKATKARNPGVRAALEAVAREYLRQAGAAAATASTQATVRAPLGCDLST